jgi:uracil-DNA glycosylase
MARKAEWEKLKERSLKRFGEESVFGEGSLNSRVAVVGEAPGGTKARHRSYAHDTGGGRMKPYRT